jgi:hypothetical protein
MGYGAGWELRFNQLIEGRIFLTSQVTRLGGTGCLSVRIAMKASRLVKSFEFFSPGKHSRAQLERRGACKAVLGACHCPRLRSN